MFQEEFRKRYTTIPLAIYKAQCNYSEGGAVSHQHKEFELLAVLEGQADLYVDSCYYKIKTGDVVVIPPYALHRIKSDKNFITSYLCICFDGALLCDKALVSDFESSTMSLGHCITGNRPHTPFLFDCLQKAYTACESQSNGWEMESVGYISLLFSKLKQHETLTKSVRNKSKTDFAKNSLTYIAEHFSQQISSRDAAAALYVNVSYFCRIFKKTFGCCFANYLTVYRLERAKWALLNTEQSVTEIAFSCGFHDCSYFAKTFRAEYGLSPRAYRNKQ